MTEKLFTGTLNKNKKNKKKQTRMMFIKHYAPNRCLCIKVANSIDHWVEDCRDVTKAGGRGDMYKERKLL